MANSIEITEDNIYVQLDIEARRKGKNLTQICKELKLNRASLHHWKTTEPKSLTIIRQIKKAIEA